MSTDELETSIVDTAVKTAEAAIRERDQALAKIDIMEKTMQDMMAKMTRMQEQMDAKRDEGPAARSTPMPDPTTASGPVALKERKVERQRPGQLFNRRKEGWPR